MLKSGNSVFAGAPLAPPPVRRRVLVGGALAAALVLSGCTVVPHEFTAADNQLRADTLMADLYAGVEPITGRLRLHEAMARALKYNLDARVKRLEAILATDRIALAGQEDMPRLTSDAGYRNRSNLNASSSADAKTGAQSLATSTSQENPARNANLQYVWNVLDLGVSYYKAKQAAHRTLIAAEQIRTIEANIIQEVRSAYWRAVAAQHSLDRIAVLTTRVRRALADTEKLNQLALADPVASLRYMRDLSDVSRRLDEQNLALKRAQIQLAALIRVPPGTRLVLAAPKGIKSPKSLFADVAELEMMALRQHPELRQKDYEIRIVADESRKAIFQMLPRVNLDAGLHYDANRFLLNNSWNDYGASISWDVFQLLRAPARKKEIEAQSTVAQGRLLALSMATIAQVHIALAKYQNDRVAFRTASRISHLDEQIAASIGNRAKEGGASELEAIKAELDLVLSRLQRDLSFGEMQDSAGQIMVTAGVDLAPDSLGGDVATIAGQIDDAEAKWSAGHSI